MVMVNPAGGFEPILVHSLLGDGSPGDLWIYSVGPLISAVVAAFAFGIQGEE